MVTVRAEIARVQKGSKAAHLGIRRGDFLLSLNKEPLRDVLDYYEACRAKELFLEVLRPPCPGEKGEKKLNFSIRKEAGELLGLTFTSPVFNGFKRCVNRCLFCFIDQLPPGLRSSLYFKDDDYRYSFLKGNFITLTNLTAGDWQRISKLRLSPLYVSVHTTNPVLRARLLGNPKAAKIREQLALLKQAKIEVHVQIVLCPGINDGEELSRTLRDLASFSPPVKSVGLVPVGLTAYRQNLFPLRTYTPTEAKQIVKEITLRQAYFQKKLGSRFVFLADEFYLQAGEKPPPATCYEEFPQFENGIGIARDFLESYRKSRFFLPPALPQRKRVALVTGVLGKKVVARVARDLSRRVKNLEVKVEAVTNAFLGPEITVGGLLGGRDLRRALQDKKEYACFFLPRSLLDPEGKLFLDGYSWAAFREELEGKACVLDGAGEIVAKVRALAGFKESLRNGCKRKFTGPGSGPGGAGRGREIHPF